MTDLVTDVLKIERMQDGGFIVSSLAPHHMGETGNWYGPRYAATSIDDALSYIKRSISPEAFK